MTSVKGDGSVEFRFFRPDAMQVHVVGDFTGWKESVLPMRATGDGWWTASTRLAEGEYRFRYLADGKWFTDYAAHGIERAPQGWNAVLVVTPKRIRTATAPGELVPA